MSDAAIALDVRRSRSTAWWGMMLVIATEATLFAVLLLSYLYLRFRATPAWPPPPIEAPTLRLPVLMTVLLVASSIPMQLAVRAARQGHGSRSRAWMIGGVVLGLGFLGAQGAEYSTKLSEFRPTTNSYGSLFYTITGMHGIHVILGLLLAAWTILFACPRCGRGGERTVENVVLYWHFVDVVWLAVFATVYLSGAL